MFTATGSVNQTATGESVIFTDLSDYTDESQLTFSSRTLSVFELGGAEIIGSPFDFSFANYPANQIEVIDDLDRSKAWVFVLTLVSISPQPGSTYVFQVLGDLNNFIYTFLYGKNQQLAASPELSNDTNFYNSLLKVYVELFNSNYLTLYNDQYLVQSALDRANQLMINDNIYF